MIPVGFTFIDDDGASTWIHIGNDADVTPAALPSYSVRSGCRLKDDRFAIAFSRSDANLNAYVAVFDFDGADFSQVGSHLHLGAIAGGTEVSIDTLSENEIVVAISGNEQLRKYTFNNPGWTLDFSTTISPSIVSADVCANAQNVVTVSDQAAGDTTLRRYQIINNQFWLLGTTALPDSVADRALLAAMGADDVSVSLKKDEVGFPAVTRKYNFSGGYAQVGSDYDLQQHGPFNALGGVARTISDASILTGTNSGSSIRLDYDDGLDEFQLVGNEINATLEILSCLFPLTPNLVIAAFPGTAPDDDHIILQAFALSPAVTPPGTLGTPGPQPEAGGAWQIIGSTPDPSNPSGNTARTYGFDFTPDGSVVYTGSKGASSGTSKVMKWSCTPSWDLESPTFISERSIAISQTLTVDIKLNDAESSLYALNQTSFTGDKIRKYTMSPFGDLSTLSLSTEIDLNALAGMNGSLAIYLNALETMIYILDGTGGIATIKEFSMSPSGDLSSLSATGKTFNILPYLSSTETGFTFKSDGTILYICDNSTGVAEFDLAIPFDLDTVQVPPRIYTLPVATGIKYFGWKDDGTRFYLVRQGLSPGSDDVYQFDVN